MEGKITLPITTNIEPHQSTIKLIFLVVKVPSAYKTILDRPVLNTLKVIVFTYHLLVRFPTTYGVKKIQGD